MSGTKLRFAFAGVLAALVAGMVVQTDHIVLAQPGRPPRQPGRIPAKAEKEEKNEDLRPLDDQDIPFGFPYERDATSQLRGAREYLGFTKEIPWNTVCPLLQNILDGRSDSFFRITEKGGINGQLHRISVKTEANRIIAAFPKEGLEFYQQSYGQTAVALLDEAVRNNYDLAGLSDLSQRYFHTAAGAEATVLLGTLYLERGNFLEAAYAFERLLARPNSDEVLTPRTLFKAALAFRRSGDTRHASLARKVADRLRAAAGRTGVRIGRTVYTVDQLRAEIDRPVAAVRPTTAVRDWSGRYGNAERNATVSGGPPFLVPAFDPTPMLATRRVVDKPGNDRIAEELMRLFDRENKSNRAFPLPGFFPIATPDLVIFRGYDGVHAIATRDQARGGQVIPAGRHRWTARTLYGLHQLISDSAHITDPNVMKTAGQWWELYKSTGVASLPFENPLLGALAHDGQYVYFLDDLAIPPPPTTADANFGAFQNQQQMPAPRDLDEAARTGQLVAAEIETGRQVWTLGRVLKNQNVPDPLPRLDEEQADKCTDAFHLCLNAVFLSPPLPLHGRLYVLIELDGVMRLLCLDPRVLVPTPEWTQRVPVLLWSQKLGRPNSSLPGDSVRRIQGAFLAAGDGILICPTNSGAVVGVDIMSHSLLWAHAYRRAAQPQTTGRRNMPFNPNMPQTLPLQLPVDRWRAAAPIVSAGRVVIAAYDSNKLDCLDIRTGLPLWSVDRQASDLYVGGVADDRVIVVGKAEVRAYSLTGTDPDQSRVPPAPQTLWQVALGASTPTGHGVIGKAAFYLPVRPEHAGKDDVPAAEVWAISLKTGEVLSKSVARPRRDGTGADLARYGLGNLVFQDGQVISQSPWEVAVYPQLEQKRAEMDRRLKANPKDPEGLTDRGELLLDEGKLAAAVADFKEAEKNQPPEPVRRRIREKLYRAYTDMLRDNFTAAEGVLPEYAALCEVPADDTGDPFEAQRRSDETLRRKRLYLYLLARGREDQHRLGEAFDHYLALAGLGEGKLFDVPDDPSVRMRPDVSARGRIEGMLRRTADPAARRELEDRVSREWEAVAAGNDLRRLREFVDVFGPYFPAGAAAELKLAETLMATKDEDDARDAQVHLARLRATADSPIHRARATEALARLMTRSGLLEDAVGLYLQLGKDFPAVVVRDGKTGAEFLTDVLTDKRLLPYLEPARYPLPTRVKVDTRPSHQQSHSMPPVELEPDGELFPMFHRLRFVLDPVAQGNANCALRSIDRVTGEVWATYPNISPPVPLNPTGFRSAKSLRASGHLLLLQVGPWVYCLDLAEKKERWRRNLLGEIPAANPNQNPIIDLAADGEVYIRYPDGYQLVIGKSIVLQPGYAALLTRDGLEVVEPVTRRELWARRNVAERTQVFGDARYILIVENTADHKPARTRLLRAVDGMPVIGAPDAGAILAAAAWFRPTGQYVLLGEGSADEPRIIRLLDLTTGKDVWRQALDAKSVPLRSDAPEWTGFVTATGEVHILATRTGATIGRFQLDPKYADTHMKGCIEAELLVDEERFYVALNRSVTAPGRTPRVQNLKSQSIDGPLYAFDRSTGRRLWFIDSILDNQMLITERFADLPVLVAGAPILEPSGNTTFRVVVIEKATGAVRYSQGLSNNSLSFQGLTVDHKNGVIELNRPPDVRIQIRSSERLEDR